MRNRVTAVVCVCAAIAAILFTVPAKANDFQINPDGPVFQLNGLIWGQSAGNGFNNNYFFTPLNPSESVCVFVYNNNPTNQHVFTASINVTADPLDTAPSGGKWNQVLFNSNIALPVFPSPASELSASVSGAAQVSVNFSASVTQAGSPDTANIRIIQTTGTCFSGQNSTQGVSVAANVSVPLLSASDTYGSAFTNASAQITNPATGAAINFVTIGTNPLRSIYFSRVTISCSAACSIEIDITTSVGVGCVASGSAPVIKLGFANAPAALAETLCATQPTHSGSLAILNLAAGIPFSFDLTGVIATPASLGGVGVFMTTGLTGNASASFQWYEK